MLEEVKVCHFLQVRLAEVGKQRGRVRRLNFIKGNRGDGFREGNRRRPDVFLHQFDYQISLVGLPSLLSDGSIVVIRGYHWLVAQIVDLRIGASCESEVGAAVRHIQRKLPLRLEKELNLPSKFLHAVSSPSLAPMSHPSCIDLSSEDKSIVSYLISLSQGSVIELMRSSAEADGCALEVVLVDIVGVVLDVELALDSQLLPHLYQGEGVLFV